MTLPAGSTKFKKEYIKKVYKYLKSKKDKSVRVMKQKNTRKGYVMYDTKLTVKLPTIEGFARYLRVARKSLYNWEKEHDNFKVALDKIRTEQKERLINMGLSGDYNSTIAKLVLSSNHGMRERSDVTTDDKPINKFSDEQIDKIADRITGRKRNDGDTPGKKKPD